MKKFKPKIYRKYEGNIKKMYIKTKFTFFWFTDFIRPKDYLEPNAPKPINLCIDDFNAVRRKEIVLIEYVNIRLENVLERRSR